MTGNTEALADGDRQRSSHAPRLSELDLARSQVAALEQLLQVHERTSLEQALKLEQSLRDRDALLASARSARDALMASEERLLLALDAGRMGTWEWDIAGNRLLWSVEQEALYGIQPGAFTGTVAAYEELIHPDDREAAKLALDQALRAGARSHHVLHRIVRPDGEVRWLDSRARFVYDDRGAQRLVGVSTDVTDRIEIEAARDRAFAEARVERQRLYDIFMQAPAAITLLEGPEHRFTVANPLYQELVGGRPMLGSTVREALPELAGQGFFELLDEVYRTGSSFSARESPVDLDLDHDGVVERIYVDFVYQALKDSAGIPFGIIVHAVDTTAQVHARQQIEQKAEQLARLTHELERSNRDLDQFAYVASHDLKAPLRGIANLTQWIEEDLGDKVTGESHDHMQLLKGRVHRMEALIDGILTYSRAGRVRDKPERIEVGQLIADVVELLAPPPETEIVIAPEMPVLETERVPLQQVFMNLIGNAIKYNRRPNARVEVSVSSEGSLVVFSVADNGPGIAPQYQERIWQIFQTLAARDKVEGTGIGLSVVRKIVEGRGGRTWLDSEPGKGSVFHFTWPRSQESTP